MLVFAFFQASLEILRKADCWAGDVLKNMARANKIKPPGPNRETRGKIFHKMHSALVAVSHKP